MSQCIISFFFFFFFFNDTATTEIYTLSLHDALPTCSATGAFCPASSPLRPLAGAAMPGVANIPNANTTVVNESDFNIARILLSQFGVISVSQPTCKQSCRSACERAKDGGQQRGRAAALMRSDRSNRRYL